MKVVTEYSAHEVDTEAGTIRRYPIHADAPDLEGDGQDMNLIRVLHCELGESAVFLVNHEDQTFLRVTDEVKELHP